MKGHNPRVGRLGRKGAKMFAKYVWTRARKAYCISEKPVPQTDTGR